ncbi:MAG: PKD domain-containing protein, partial [Alphaproteobacteria bacterium]
DYVLAAPAARSYILYAEALAGEIGVRDIAAGTYDFYWLDTATGTTLTQSGVAVAGGSRTWPRPAGIGTDVAVWIAPAGGSGGDGRAGNQPPTARATASPAAGDAPLAVTFDASASDDADGRIVAYAWDFGDGTRASGAVVSHTYTNPGTYSTLLSVTDDAGAAATTTVRVSVADPAGGATGHRLLVSTRPERTGAVPLSGQTVSGAIYVFVDPEDGIRTSFAERVDFYLDDPTMRGAPVQRERSAPYDFAGGDGTLARPFDTGTLARGSHTITAAVPLADGTTEIIHAVFTVN